MCRWNLIFNILGIKCSLLTIRISFFHLLSANYVKHRCPSMTAAAYKTNSNCSRVLLAGKWARGVTFSPRPPGAVLIFFVRLSCARQDESPPPLPPPASIFNSHLALFSGGAGGNDDRINRCVIKLLAHVYIVLSFFHCLIMTNGFFLFSACGAVWVDGVGSLRAGWDLGGNKMDDFWCRGWWRWSYEGFPRSWQPLSV